MSAADNHLMSIFSGALEHESDFERAAYLDRACGRNAELRSRVDALLRAHEGAGRFMESRADQSATATPVEAATVTEVPTGQEPGLIVAGRYQLLEVIGEGGMGTVWLAEQREPVRRRVALKLIKSGMDSREVVGRFEAERQALALMDHPNIAKVHDGGVADGGRPFFVMELVRGVPVTEYCDRARLGVHERLALFIQICQALQHAHQKGIIHRDLKPSNILVTEHEPRGAGVVKVIDFGVAKAIGPSLTDDPVHTKFMQMVGTPLYMSPEQAERRGQDVDTRADIYSLGVLLYELLTGTTPFDKDRFKEIGYDEVRRIIR
jgi:eukaryotic-like serine/threonine-protein kinase